MTEGASEAFEGSEKKLEVDFKRTGEVGSPKFERGLRDAITREQWDGILEVCQCTILSHVASEHFDAYVLSESSLFVYERKVMIKTCGTTTLLKGLPLLLELARPAGYCVEFLAFARKNLMFPHVQEFPHENWASEVQFLQKLFCNVGSAHVLGPLTSDHWYLYFVDFSERPNDEETDQTLEIMMTGLPVERMQMFYEKEGVTARDVRKKSGIEPLLTGALVDDHLFSTCGYSLNGINGKSYYTIHVTPEEACSYVSFETNLPARDYSALVRGVLEAFQPAGCTVVLFCDLGSAAKQSGSALQTRKLGSHYKCANRTTYDFEGTYNVTLWDLRRLGRGACSEIC